jgi:hypothetical protein
VSGVFLFLIWKDVQAFWQLNWPVDSKISCEWSNGKSFVVG